MLTKEWEKVGLGGVGVVKRPNKQKQSLGIGLPLRIINILPQAHKPLFSFAKQKVEFSKSPPGQQVSYFSSSFIEVLEGGLNQFVATTSWTKLCIPTDEDPERGGGTL